MTIGGLTGNKPTPIAPNLIPYGSPGSFDAAVNQQGGDYDKINSEYDQLIKSSSENPQQRLNYTPIAPNSKTYEPSSGLQSALAQFQSVANTGGYSPGDIGNIRARSVSPIRAIYANAQRGLARQKNLQGGYSPNYGAASTKLARELSDTLGTANTNVEATIAEMVNKNKMAALPGIANLATTEAGMKASFDANEQARIDRINEQNATLPLQYAQVNNATGSQAFNNRLQAIEGKRTLYGTTPALVNTFGNQVANATQLRNQQAQQQQQQQLEQERAAMAFANSFGGRI